LSIELSGYCRRRCEQELPERWRRIEEALAEALDLADYKALVRIVDGRGWGSAHAQLVALAGPEPSDDRVPDGYRSIAERAGWLDVEAGDGSVVPMRPDG
jgi:hypothetical protein